MTANSIKRIAVNCGAGYVPGLDAVLTGIVRAAHGLGWEVFGIRDGYDGLICPERYPEGGVLTLSGNSVESLGVGGGNTLGTGAHNDPFRMREVDEHNAIVERDRSDDLLRDLKGLGIDAVISIVGGSAITGLHALSVAYKLSRKGLRTICVPKSVENEIASVPQAFGYNSVLSHTIETLQGIRAGARDSGQIAVVELPGHHAGWLALQSGVAVLADAILLPEFPYDLVSVADRLSGNERSGRKLGLILVAEGAHPVAIDAKATGRVPVDDGGFRSSLAPNSNPDFGEGLRVIDRTGIAAQNVASALRHLMHRDFLPFSLGLLVRGGAPSAVDLQLGLAYGSSAVRALRDGLSDVMVAFHNTEVAFVPLVETLNRVRTVPVACEFVQLAQSLGISIGDEQ